MTSTPLSSKKGPKDPEYLSTLERGLSVLRAFDQDHAEMTLSEVAATTGLSPAVARRSLNTLLALGYVAQYGRRFLLRPEVLLFTSGYLSSMNIEQVALPHLQRLRDETGDSTSMAVLSGADILYVAHVSTSRPIRLGANVGTRFPWHVTSLGKALLAFQREDVREDRLAAAPFLRFTEASITARPEMEARLSLVVERGYDAAQEELDHGILSVAVPIFGPNSTAIAAINCSTSTSRTTHEELVRTRLPLLRIAAREIEAALRRWPALGHSLSHP